MNKQIIESEFGPEAEYPIRPSSTLARASLLPDPRRVMDIVRRRIWIFLLVAATIVATSMIYAKLAPRYYEATARIQIQPRTTDVVTSGQTGLEEERERSADFIDTQLVIASGPKIARAAAGALGLDNDPQFSGDAKTTDERLENAGDGVRGSTAVRRVAGTSLIEVIGTAREPELAASIANAVVSEYLASLSSDAAAQEQQTSQKVDSRLDELRFEAEQADAAVLEYKIAHGLLSAEGATMAEQETSAINQQIASARANLAEKQGRLGAARRQLADGGGGGDVSSALNSGTIMSLRAQEAESSRNLAELRVRYGPNYPAIAQEEGRLADIRGQIQSEIDRIFSSLRGEVNVAQSGLDSLLLSQSQSQSRLAANEAAQAGYRELERKAAAARSIYEAFLSSSKGAAARDGIKPPVAVVSALATVPKWPSLPNTRLIHLFGVLMGIVGGGLAIAAAEFLDSGIKSRSDVEHRLGAQYLGAIPDIGVGCNGAGERPEAHIVTRPLSAFAESVRSLRTSVTLSGRDRPQVIALSSPLPTEGKSTTALCLARSLAMTGFSTLLLDCDLRHHSASSRILGDRQGRLLDVLAGTQRWDEATVKDYETDLHILGSTQDLDEQVDPLTSETLSRLLAQLRPNYDFIVVDTAPLLGVADARTVARFADAVVLLALWRKTSMRAVDAALDLLVSVNANIVGVALTKVNVNKFGSSREELYGYQKQFKGYYSE